MSFTPDGLPRRAWALFVISALAIPWGCSQPGKELHGRIPSAASSAKAIQASLAAAALATRRSSKAAPPVSGPPMSGDAAPSPEKEGM
jgi:hypothetical protein